MAVMRAGSRLAPRAGERVREAPDAARVLAGRAAELEQLLPTIMYMVLVASDGPAGAAAKAGLLSAASA